LHFNHIGAQI